MGTTESCVCYVRNCLTFVYINWAQVTLEVITRSRSAGVMQNELPKMFGKQPTNFSYTLKKLLALELIVRSPVKLRVSKQSSATLSTALLRHVAFARCKFEAHDQVF
jgi:B-block binding subunit of TFIIIC